MKLKSDEDLIMSGSQLTKILGCSMKKVRLAIATESVGFPKPVKKRRHGKNQILFYSRESILEFRQRVDMAKLSFSLSEKKRNPATESGGFDQSLYFQFMGISKNGVNAISKCGYGKYGDGD